MNEFKTDLYSPVGSAGLFKVQTCNYMYMLLPLTCLRFGFLEIVARQFGYEDRYNTKRLGVVVAFGKTYPIMVF